MGNRACAKRFALGRTARCASIALRQLADLNCPRPSWRATNICTRMGRVLNLVLVKTDGFPPVVSRAWSICGMEHADTLSAVAGVDDCSGFPLHSIREDLSRYGKDDCIRRRSSSRTRSWPQPACGRMTAQSRQMTAKTFKALLHFLNAATTSSFPRNTTHPSPLLQLLPTSCQPLAGGTPQ